MHDLAIIGAGIVGSSAAYHAVTEGADVVLIDAGHAGRATDAGAGIISPVGLDRGEPAPAWARLIADSVAYYRGLFAELAELGPWPEPPIFRIVGEIVLATDDADLDWLGAIEARLASAEARQRHGLTRATSRLSGEELRRHWPELRSDLTGLFLPDVGRVDGRELARRLQIAAERRAGSGGGRLTMISGTATVQPDATGVAVWLEPPASGSGNGGPFDRLRERHPSTGSGNEEVGRSESGRVVRARAALLAAGAWLGADPGDLGIGPTIRPDKGQIVHLSVPGAGTATRPVINTRSGGYFLGFDDRVVVGATHEDAGFSATVTAGGQASVLTRALDLAPGLADAPLIETRVGLRPTCEDGLPLVGPTAIPGVHLANGLSAWGLTLGPMLGGVAAREALGGTPDARFGFLNPIRARSG